MTANQDWLPTDLIDTADHVITCSPLNAVQLGELVSVMTDGPPTEPLPSDDVIAGVTTRQFLLARAGASMKNLAHSLSLEVW